MDNYGFYLTSLILKGKNKINAEIQFNKGLNVISGASNTGKTYIFDCIDFIFGSKGNPKEISESKGYTEVLAEIYTYQGQTITLKRNLTDKKMFFYDCNIDKVNEVSPEEIKDHHDKDDEKNISTLLLKLCGADYKNVLKNAKKYTESFTYRDFVHITMLHEQRIISNLSPIFMDMYKKTKYKSVFKTIITGIDDSNFKDVKKNDNSKTKIEAKIELIDNLILNVRDNIKELELKLSDSTIDYKTIESNIENLRIQISKKQSILKETEENKEYLWQQLQKKQNDKMLSCELTKRFDLLKRNYKSDLERLEFIGESEYYLSQLVDVKCPLCNSAWNGIDSNTNEQELKTALYAEKEKIELQLYDLLSTTQDIQWEISNKEKEIIDVKDKIDNINKTLDNELKPAISKYLSVLDKLFGIRDDYKRKEYNVERVQQLEETKTKLIASLNMNTIENPVAQEISDTIINEFCDIIKSILEGWKIEDSIDVKFDNKCMDTVINEKPKGSFGKGYSALLNSAFILALMQYEIKYGLPHPKIIILDSPLAAFKERDHINSDSEGIKDIVKQAFYRYLYKNFKDVQVIILENIDPPEDIQEKIKYYHFTKDRRLGRYGFIPVIR